MTQFTGIQTERVMLTSFVPRIDLIKWYKVSLIATVTILVLGIWMSSGTMAPYAASSGLSIVTMPCHYLVNVDHWHFKAVFQMLDGENRNLWESSVVLRRMLLPLISLPLMKGLGFEIGGFISSIVIHIAA